MNIHDFNFEGGKYLTKMGACWFVSYCYYRNIYQTHEKWKKVQNRSSTYNRTKEFHKNWLTKVLEMNNKKLNTNKMELKAEDVKSMAKKLLLSDILL